MRLIGAKEFLNTVKPGTLCVQFWMRSVTECIELINDYKEGLDVVDLYGDDYFIFGDNSGSLMFGDCDWEVKDVIEIKGKEYTCLDYTDLNIIGDASPYRTLYLVFDNEDEYPEYIDIVYSGQRISKEEIINIRDWFKTADLFHDEINNPRDWIVEFFKDTENDPIINYKYGD